MALIEFKTLGNVDRGTIHVYANNLINTYYNGENKNDVYNDYEIDIILKIIWLSVKENQIL